jgi:hypothetical protein
MLREIVFYWGMTMKKTKRLQKQSIQVALFLGLSSAITACTCDDIKVARMDLLTIKSGINRGLKDPQSWEGSCAAMKRALISFATSEQKLADISQSSCKDNPNDATCDLVVGMSVNAKTIQKESRAICEKMTERSINGQDPENTDEIIGKGRKILRAVMSLEDKLLAAQITNKCSNVEIQQDKLDRASTQSSSYKEDDSLPAGGASSSGSSSRGR